MNCVATSASARHVTALLHAVRLPHTNYPLSFLHILFQTRQPCQLVNRAFTLKMKLLYFLPENAHSHFLTDKNGSRTVSFFFFPCVFKLRGRGKKNLCKLIYTFFSGYCSAASFSDLDQRRRNVTILSW